jgi:hypothetical protein
MPQPIIHVLVCQAALKKSLPELWTRSSRFAAFGSLAPDLFYAMAAEQNTYANLANAIHHGGTHEVFCYLLDYIKQQSIHKSRTGKWKAFAYGFYCHVITDCVFHPYVYRETHDHWLHHSPQQYEAHRKLEAKMDQYILSQHSRLFSGYRSKPDIGCQATIGSELFDAGIVTLLGNSIKTVYHYEVDYTTVMEASAHAIPAIDFRLAEMDSMAPLNRGHREKTIKRNAGDLSGEAFSGDAWFATSVTRLYSYAVQACREIIREAEGFLQSDNAQASRFMRQSSCPYLLENYNLDTGLPSRLNDDMDNQADDAAVRFAYGLDILEAQYLYCRELADTP